MINEVRDSYHLFALTVSSLVDRYPQAVAGLPGIFGIGILPNGSDGCRSAHAPGVPLAGWEDAAALGGGGAADDREELSPHHGLQGFVEAQSCLGQK
jgi:hypothetical protein